jgi:CO/xanthine dehydrogenase Mo-binding subunit
MTRNIMARDKALYEGHAVAAVAATSKAIADEALSLIAVDYEVLPHVIDVDEAMKPDAPLVLRRLGLNKLSALEPAEPVRRYEREHPGQLIHLDIKKLGRGFEPLTSAVRFL